MPPRQPHASDPIMTYRNVQQGGNFSPDTKLQSLMSSEGHSNPSPKHCTSHATARGEYALWVGNIPSPTTIMRLRDYFSFAMPTQHDLLSISYNPDARYAFINFQTESARILAIEQAAHYLFDTKRLDCRVRNGSNRSTKVSYGLHLGRPGQPIAISPEQPDSLHHKVEELSHFPEADTGQHGQGKYFVLKSYSLETLYRSLGSGLWHVPKRHVERLNHAFQTASKVYLIFSVNGSGRFFGYASMRAEIRKDEEFLVLPAGTDLPSRILDVPNNWESPNSDDDLKTDPLSRRQSLSSCTSSCSTGSISYDPQRRKITWHAPWSCHQTKELKSSFDDLPMNRSSGSSTMVTSPSRPDPGTLISDLTRYTRPCEVKWLSTQSIPFDEIRGLRNAWNSNKEIHIARNVTAVEPNSATSLLKRWEEKEEYMRSI